MIGMLSRDEIEAAVAAWERHARRETYLPEPLHFKARAWLIEEIERAILAKAGQHASDCSTHNAPALPAGECDCSPEGARNGASEGHANVPADAGSEPTMDDLKGKLKGKQTASKRQAARAP